MCFYVKVYEHINREVMDSIQRVFSSDIKDIAYAVLEGVSVMSADEMNTTLSTKVPEHVGPVLNTTQKKTEKCLALYWGVYFTDWYETCSGVGWLRCG